MIDDIEKNALHGTTGLISRVAGLLSIASDRPLTRLEVDYGVKTLVLACLTIELVEDPREMSPAKTVTALGITMELSDPKWKGISQACVEAIQKEKEFERRQADDQMG